MTISAHPGNECTQATTVDYTNNCAFPVEIRICIAQTDGGRDCGLDFYVAPGASSHYWGCNTSGAFTWLAGDVSDSSVCFAY